MNVKEIIDNILSREGLYRNIANPFASTDLIIQENIRILNQLICELILKNSLSELLRRAIFKTYSVFTPGKELLNTDVIYSGQYRYRVLVDAIPQVDPGTLNLTPGQTGIASDGVQWECLGDWNQYPWDYIANDIKTIDTKTMMNYTRKTEMTALNTHQWMRLECSSVQVGTTGLYHIRDNSIYIFPGLADGTEIRFLYFTSLPIIAADGSRKSEFTTYTDTSIIPEQILIMGTAYRYLRDKDIGNWNGLEAEYNNEVRSHEARGQAPQQISLTGSVISNVSNYNDGNWYVG